MGGPKTQQCDIIGRPHLDRGKMSGSVATKRRAANGQGGVYPYKTKDGRKFYRVTYLALDTDSGVLKPTSKRGFVTQDDAVKFRAKAVSSAASGGIVRPRSETVKTYVDSWLERLRLRESTRHSY